jgi:hypothetical protein
MVIVEVAELPVETVTSVAARVKVLVVEVVVEPTVTVTVPVDPA